MGTNHTYYLIYGYRLKDSYFNNDTFEERAGLEVEAENKGFVIVWDMCAENGHIGFVIASSDSYDLWEGFSIPIGHELDITQNLNFRDVLDFVNKHNLHKHIVGDYFGLHFTCIIN